MASGVILTAQISTRLLAAPDYFEAWRYVPVLTLATTFACLGSFLSSIYMVEQRSGATLVTTMLGAAAKSHHGQQIQEVQGGRPFIVEEYKMTL